MIVVIDDEIVLLRPLGREETVNLDHCTRGQGHDEHVPLTFNVFYIRSFDRQLDNRWRT